MLALGALLGKGRSWPVAEVQPAAANGWNRCNPDVEVANRDGLDWLESVHFLSGQVPTSAHWFTVARSAAAQPRGSWPWHSLVLLPSRHAGTPLTIALSMPRATCVGASKFGAHPDVACAA